MQNTEIRRLQIWKQWKEFRKEIGTIKPLKIILLYTRSFWLLQIFISIKINNRYVSFIHVQYLICHTKMIIYVI